jgi:hypothetical protein
MHSNLYVLWEPRDARRRKVLEAAAGGVSTSPLCEYHGGTRWVLLPFGAAVDESRVEAVYSTPRYTVYRVRDGLC